jgi:signal transduction histidine kinase
MVIAALVESVLTPGHAVAVVFAVPIIIAARFSTARATVVFGIIAILLEIVNHLVNDGQIVQWPVDVLSLAIIVVLSAQVASLRERERRRAREAEEARGQLMQFISLVVHDLRSPLTVAMGYLQVAERQLGDVSAALVRPPIDRTMSALRQILRLVDDLLDAARLERGRFVIQPEPCDLAELARDVVDGQRLTDTNHSYILDAPAHLTGVWDKTRCQQVLTNLVSNAAKYSWPGTEVRVRLRPEDGSVIVSVGDQGVGLATTDIDQLFEPFARPGQEREATGTGLGLYISKGIVEAHGGRIWVESTVGRGSTFYVRLPRRPVDGNSEVIPDLRT